MHSPHTGPPTAERGSIPALATTGLVVHWAARYDLLVWLLTRGRERRFRRQLLEPAHLRRGETVLDVGCGTGTLAILAKQQVGQTGSVTGVDASKPMIKRARKKATRAGEEVTFLAELAEALPFADATFDVVLSTVMLHHLPKRTRRAGVREMRRVVKPGGRVLLVDFIRSGKRGLLAHFHRHGRVDPRDLIELATGAGLSIIESGPIGVWDLQFVLARPSG
jgi:ubiquinone/menaquinone biosynthesis C-methylase UbiE